MRHKAGALGSIAAQRDLGALYTTGDWTGPKDPVRAAEWYRRAAERGHPDAQYNFGFMHVLGEGLPADHEEGLRWLHLAAGQGDGAAMRLLADLYRNGYYGVPMDPAQAARWEEQYKRWEEQFERWKEQYEKTLATNAETADPPV